MKTILLKIAIFILLVSCSERNSNNDIEKFENILGDKRSSALTELVKEFEEFLNTNFTHLSTEQAYHECLTIIQSEKEFKWNISSELITRIDSLYEIDGLREQIRTKPIKTWIENNGVLKIYKYEQDQIVFKDTIYRPIDQLERLYKTSNLDSILEFEKYIYKFNWAGTFIKALDSIKENKGIISSFSEIKHFAGQVDMVLLADLLVRNRANYDDYFIKRIIATELFY